uniref:alpha-glucan water dikinase 1, chloroplastic isoform X2 n=1 Tax=Fragaria vesca subsp. vesca TaxID=101020 RepID=UPI0005C81221|nr:PREDICTED: alpha-glucan water dikinase 1, chloroplastic isoform X2 [Fragaria vesca subsp. vesca]XP_011464044.1 PREDICTED: alpha-glucan water dikinase 1, chloroplastic isoform X2 [Fragaria vesca subsp. vesca]
MSSSVSHNLLQSKINPSGIPANTLLRPKCVHQVPAQPRKSSLSKKFCGNSLQKPKLAMGSRRPVTFVPCAVLTTDQRSDQLASKYNLDGNIELQVYVDASSPGSTKVDIHVSNSGDSLVLHWGGIQDRKENWVLPSRHPDGTTVYKKKALRTPFAKSGPNSSLKIEIDDPAIQAIEFLIVDESQNRWFKNNGGNFHVKLPLKEMSISNVSVPEDLVQIQAYLRWERKGKQMYTPEQEKVEYEAARTELLEEVARGASIQELQARLTKKSDSGNSHEQSQAGNKEVSKAAKKHESKQVYRTGRINRKQRDLMKILNKHTTKPVDEAKLANEESAKPKALKAVELFAKEKEEQDGASTLNKQIYKLGDKDLLVLVTKVADKIRVHLATDIKEPVNLHWALSVNRAGEWLEPPPNVLPQGSVSLNGAVETQFVSSSVDSTYEIQSLEIETQEKSFKGMPFVLCSSGNWIKNQGSDFYADFGVAVKKVQKDAGDGKGTAKALLDNIADLESEAQKSFMHRFNIAADLMSQAKDAGALGLAGILVWMRFMATRQLIWNKNYNVKPREISKAQDRLTDLLQSIYISYPQHRELLRMILSTVGRGGEGDVGQRIRDEILVIQRNCDCKGGMMEEWHQKLHNNTSPDDVVICQALIDYIKSDFDIGVYWKTLNDNGITKERLLSYDRAIHNEPRFRADQKDRLLHDLGNYLRTLKAVHSGADLESAITNCLGYSAKGQGFMVGVQINPVSGLPSEVPGLLQFVMEHVEDRNVEVLVEGLLEARQEIWPLLSKPNDRLKDLLFLDIALDSTVRTAIERGYEELNNAGPEKIMYFISMVLENLALSSDDNEDLLYCLKGWNQALNMLKNNADHWALFAKSILDRTRLALANKAELYHSILQPSAEYLGSKLGVDKLALSIFTEEVIRAGSAASLSTLVNRLDPVLRKTANLGSWQVISPVEVVGYVVVVDELLTVQNKVYDKPTILVARSVRGEEEIPDGTVAVLTPDMPDVLSHVSVRARNSKVCFATCFDSNILADLQACEGKLLRVKPTSADVVYSEVNESELGDASSTNLNEDTPALTLVKKQFTGRYAISSDEFTSEMVGAKSRNISYIKGKLPSWVGIPTSVALPFGVFEKVLSEDSNKAVADKIETLKKKLKEGDFGSLGEIRETVLQLTAPPPLVQELKSKMQSSGMPWPGDEGEQRWEQAWLSIKKVWASKWNERAYFSTRKVKLDHDYLCMAVLVQEIINADYAFVIHTTNPSSGDSSEIYAEVVKGLGETLVGAYPGRALSFISKKNDLDSPQLLGYPSKPIGLFIRRSIIFRSDSNGEDLEGYAGAGLYDSVPMDKEEEVVLDYSSDPLVTDGNFQKKILSSIAHAGNAIEELYGLPQDIEGVIRDGKLYVVQTRPQM